MFTLNGLINYVGVCFWLFLVMAVGEALLHIIMFEIKKSPYHARETSFLMMVVYFIGAITSGVLWLILTQI